MLTILNRLNHILETFKGRVLKMIEDYCPECGHLLSNDKLCAFCNFSQSDEHLDNSLIEMFDWVKEDYDRPILL